MIKRQSGQAILALILIMTVALAIGLSVVQKSLTDVSTSTKVEESSRAFSAAEAGIEKSLQSDSAIISPNPLGNDASIQSVSKNTVPDAKQALEYPPLAKEELAQVWLVSPNDLTSEQYTAPALDIYWGNVGVTGADKPAIEITVVYQDSSGAYQGKKYFYDPDAAVRNNSFTVASNCPSDSISTSLSTTAKSFFCKQTIDVSSTTLTGTLTGLRKLILLRARLLYSGTSQPFAVKPATNFSLPVQGRLFTSTGVSGETQRRVQVFRLDKVVPPYFDYAIFSLGDIKK